MNTPDWARWDLNSCFGAFRTIRVHLVPFGCLTKLGAKQAEVVQKFVPRSHVGIFHNEPLDPPYWILSSCFGALCTIWLHLGQSGYITTLSAKRAKLVQKFVQRSRVEIFRNERTRSTPLDPKLVVLVRFVLFGCIRDCLVALRNSVQNRPN